jgi:hypothetical protein
LVGGNHHRHIKWGHRPEASADWKAIEKRGAVDHAVYSVMPLGEGGAHQAGEGVTGKDLRGSGMHFKTWRCMMGRLRVTCQTLPEIPGLVRAPNVS